MNTQKDLSSFLTILTLTGLFVFTVAHGGDLQAQNKPKSENTTESDRDYLSPEERAAQKKRIHGRIAQKKKKKPERPWTKWNKKDLPPAKPGEDYTPVTVPNGRTLPYKVKNGVKIYHLTLEEINQEIVPGKMELTVWGFNGLAPGPVIEAAVGDRVRIYVTNNLPKEVPTGVHWHGFRLPAGQDGVPGLTQPTIKPGETYKYEFTLTDPGTFMYHSHMDTMTQEGMGLTGMFVVHRRLPPEKRPERDFAIMLGEWQVSGGTSRPNTLQTDFNILTMNGKMLPATEPLVAETGDDVIIRFGNLSALDHHPIHLHGYEFKVTGSIGWVDPKGKLPQATVLVGVGQTKAIQFKADNPGDWIMHCHMTHHIMNQMAHDLPNMVGADMKKVDKKIRKLIKGYKMAHGTKGMKKDMTETGLPVPDNSIPMLGANFQFGKTTLGGMATVLRVRDNLDSYENTEPYDFPEGTVADEATKKEMMQDGIEPSDSKSGRESQSGKGN
jgi:hypothetical protein